MERQGQYFIHTNAIIQMAVQKLCSAVHWRTFEEIASGSFSKVYRVSYEKNRYFSLKIEPAVNSEILEMIERQEREGYRQKSRQVSEMIQNEIDTMKQLSSGEGSIYVVKYADDWALELDYMKYRIPCYVILMEHVQDVKHLLQDPAFRTEQQLLKLAVDIGYALKYLHTKNQVHNDIKVSNIFYAKELHSYKLGDYSISTNYQKEQVLGGSPGYMAPEVYRYMQDRSNPFPDTKKADLYSFGIMLYKLLNGNRFPYGDACEEQLYRPDRAYDLPEIPGVHAELLRIVNQACRYDPAERYDSVNAMLVELSNLYVAQNEIHNTDDKNTITTYMPSMEPAVAEDWDEPGRILPKTADIYGMTDTFTDEVQFLDSVIHGVSRSNRKRKWLIGLGIGAAAAACCALLVVWNLSGIYRMIGDNYYNQADLVQAVAWYEKADHAGDQEAHSRIAQIYRDEGVRCLEQKDYNHAIELLTQAKELGITENQKFKNQVIAAYLGRGQLRQKNAYYAEAEADFLEAYDLGSSDAGYYLGMLWGAKGNPQADPEKALYYLEQAHTAGNAQAVQPLAELYNLFGAASYQKKQYSAAAEYYQKSAMLGDAMGQYQTGRSYYEGYGVEQSYQKAVEWLTKAVMQEQPDAEQLLPEAEYALASSFFKKKDYGNALYYATQAAESGNADAQYQIGLMYYYGYGVDKNPEQSLTWLEDAASGGNRQAPQLISSVCIAAGKEAYEQEQYETALRYYESLDSVTEAEVLYEMGVSYYRTTGARQSNEKACSCLIDAEDAGSTKASKLLPEVLYAMGKESYLAGNYKEAFACYSEAADRDNLDALYATYYCYQNGVGVKRNRAYATAFWIDFQTGGGDSSNPEYAYLKAIGSSRD